jgi:hypothetical protein
VSQWTQHIPLSNPKHLGYTRIIPGNYPIVDPDPNRPVHLHAGDIYILFGGHQLAQDGVGLHPVGSKA